MIMYGVPLRKEGRNLVHVPHLALELGTRLVWSAGALLGDPPTAWAHLRSYELWQQVGSRRLR